MTQTHDCGRAQETAQIHGGDRDEMALRCGDPVFCKYNGRGKVVQTHEEGAYVEFRNGSIRSTTKYGYYEESDIIRLACKIIKRERY